MLGAPIPAVPARLSQVDAAVRMVDETELGHLIKPTTVARRLYDPALLEGGRNRPYAIHQQLQSQVFYRMMIERYEELKLRAIDDAIRNARRTGTPVTLKIPVMKGNQQVPPFDNRLAYTRYDRLTAEFWENYARSYADAYRMRLQSGTEEMSGPSHNFLTTFADLPEDKKRAFAHWSAEKADRSYKQHLASLYTTSFGPYVHPELPVDTREVERRISGGGTSSSARGW